MTDLDNRLAAFGNQLRQLRARAGYLTGKEFAERLGWQQSKVSRLENGKQTATDSDVLDWLAATGAPESAVRALQDELREIRIQAASWSRQLQKDGGHLDRQKAVQQTESMAIRIRAFEMALVPGLVQTADYARHVLTAHANLHGATADVDRAVAVRLERQRILYDSNRFVELLITESALRYPPCPPAVMAAQIDRLMTLTGLPTVRFGIIRLGTRIPVIPMHGFWIMDDNEVVVETIDSEITAGDPVDLELYHRVADALWSVAVTGDDVRALLVELSHEYAG